MVKYEDLESYCGYFDEAGVYVVEVSMRDVEKILKEYFNAEEVKIR